MSIFGIPIRAKKGRTEVIILIFSILSITAILLWLFQTILPGWQYRWFEIHPERGQLEYYYYEDPGLDDLLSGKHKSRKIGNKGKKEHLAGAVVVPSDEDSQTFYVNFASGESYKLRASNVRERQVWVDRLRAVSQLHDRAIAHSNPPVS